MKRTFCSILIIAGLLVPMVLWAGGQQDGGEAEAGQLAEFDAIFDRILLEENGQDEWAQEFKELTGVEINIVKPPHNEYSQILGTTFAAGDLPDICEIQTADYLTYANSGNLAPLDDYIKAAKNLKSVPKEFYEAYRLKDGHIYGFPTYAGGGCVTYLRKDWLDNLGLKVPTNWKEFYAVIKAFTFDDPDGNGKDDTIGLTIPFQVPAMEFDYYNRFIMQDAWFGFTVKNGKWVDGFTEPEMVEALQRWQDLYEEEVIDTEFFSNKTSTARSKIYEGQAGVMEYWAGTWGERFHESAVNTNPDANVIAINAIKESDYISRVGPCFAITVDAEYPGQIFDKVINTMWDKGEGQMLWTFGVEGLHYELADGKVKMLPEPSNPDRPFDKAFIDPTLTMNGWDLPVDLNEKIAASIEIHREDSIQLSLPQGGDTYVKNIGELMSMKQEVFSKIVVGEYSVEEGLEVYKQKAAGLKIDQIMSELNS